MTYSFDFQSQKLDNVFHSFEEASASILQLMGKFININTLFIAENDKNENKMIKVFNRNNQLIQKDSTLPFEETYCKLAIDNGSQPLVISDLTENELSRHLNVTKNFGSGCFIGIPINYGNGDNYGTLCGLDTKPFQFTEDHLEMFQTMASLLTYMLEHDKALTNIQCLSTPLVPITQGVAILPLIGEMNTLRSQTTLEIILNRSKQLSLNHLVIDLSGITKLDSSAINDLLKMAKALKLLGVAAIVTGIRPDMVRHISNTYNELGDIIVQASLEKALSHIGFTLNYEK